MTSNRRAEGISLLCAWDLAGTGSRGAYRGAPFTSVKYSFPKKKKKKKKAQQQQKTITVHLLAENVTFI